MKMDEASLDLCVVFMPLFLLRKRLCEISALICLSRLCFVVGTVTACQFLLSRRNWEHACTDSNHRHHSKQCAQWGALFEPGCCPRNQKQPYPDHDNPDGSRHALALWCEAFGSDCRRYKSHHPQIHDPDDEEDRRQTSTRADAAKAEAQPISPSRAGIRRKHAAVPRHLPAAGKVMGLPRAELERASHHDDNTDRDRNNSRQLRPLHYDLGKGRAQWENNNSEHSPDEEVPDAD
jgi:hypothetical protein